MGSYTAIRKIQQGKKQTFRCVSIVFDGHILIAEQSFKKIFSYIDRNPFSEEPSRIQRDLPILIYNLNLVDAFLYCIWSLLFAPN